MQIQSEITSLFHACLLLFQRQFYRESVVNRSLDLVLTEHWSNLCVTST